MKLKEYLDKVIWLYLAMLFTEISLIENESKFEEHGDPGIDRENYCQIEASVLEKFMDEGVPTVHLMIPAYAEYMNSIGVSLFISSKESAYWSGDIYEFRQGIPHIVFNEKVYDRRSNQSGA